MTDSVTCSYPDCSRTATRSIAVHVQPELIEVVLCEEHIAMAEGQAPSEPDFRRWLYAMLGTDG